MRRFSFAAAALRMTLGGRLKRWVGGRVVAELAGMREDLGSVAFHVIDIGDANAFDFAQQRRQRGLAGLKGLPPKVAAVELNQVKGVQERGPATAQPIET